MPESFAIIDFEATGLSFAADAIEAGFALWSPGKPIRTWSSLVRPVTEHSVWNEDAAAIHRIRPEDLIHAPHPREVATVLNTHLGPIGTAYCDGLPYDDMWLRNLFHDAKMTPRFILEPMFRLPNIDGKRMVTWLKSNPAPHRAGKDALRLMRAYAYGLHEKPEIIDL